MDSDPAGNLMEGEIIVVSETKKLGNGTMRVHFDRGWTSVTAKSGKVLLQMMVDEEQSIASANSGSDSANSDSATSPAKPMTIQDRIDDVLVETCTNLRKITAVIIEADAKKYRHPSLAALRNKAASLVRHAQRPQALHIHGRVTFRL